MYGGLLCAAKLTDKGFVLGFIHRAVYIIRCTFVIARSKKRVFHIHAIKRHDRRDGIVKMQPLTAAEFGYLVRQCIACKRTCRNNALSVGKARGFGRDDLYIFAGTKLFRYVSRKGLSVNGKGASGRDAVMIGAFHDERAQPAQLGL